MAERKQPPACTLNYLATCNNKVHMCEHARTKTIKSFCRLTIRKFTVRTFLGSIIYIWMRAQPSSTNCWAKIWWALAHTRFLWSQVNFCNNKQFRIYKHFVAVSYNVRIRLELFTYVMRTRMYACACICPTSFRSSHFINCTMCNLRL